MGRRWLPGQGQGMGRKGVGSKGGGCASHAEAHTREGRPDLGGGMVQGGLADRLAEIAPASSGFELLPRRWVVERTFSWLSQNRRMSKDYERLCSTSESFVYAAMTRLMVRRLACV